METIREQLNKPLVTAGIGLVVGLILGLTVLGWGLFPVRWVDASPALLRPDLQQDYLRMVIDSYTKNQDKALAQARWNELGPNAPEIMTAIQENPQGLSMADISAFTAVVQGEAAISEVQPTATPTGGGGGLKSSLPLILGLLFVLTLVVGAALVYMFVLRNRIPTPSVSEPPAIPSEGKKFEPAVVSQQAQDPPVAQFMTTYMSGDDLYDDSFSIDSPSGEFLGECGVGISDTIGVGDPKKVTAFEVWLFDKNDIQTVTKVLMSSHAFDDPTIRQRLESKGEPMLTEPGKKILLETATLQLEARIVDMNYGQGAMPTSSFFERLTLELAVWPKVTQPA
ncbi:MAG: hypothetical protein M1281_07650 [Chloroflexi bacterium]|nr:hypothetical protein [Chloroflexota bacterium]